MKKVMVMDNEGKELYRGEFLQVITDYLDTDDTLRYGGGGGFFGLYCSPSMLVIKEDGTVAKVGVERIRFVKDEDDVATKNP